MRVKRVRDPFGCLLQVPDSICYALFIRLKREQREVLLGLSLPRFSNSSQDQGALLRHNLARRLRVEVRDLAQVDRLDVAT